MGNCTGRETKESEHGDISGGPEDDPRKFGRKNGSSHVGNLYFVPKNIATTDFVNRSNFLQSNQARVREK